jgi:hypothetical protein
MGKRSIRMDAESFLRTEVLIAGAAPALLRLAATF